MLLRVINNISDIGDFVSASDITKYESVLEIFTRTLQELKSPAERKLFLISASEMIQDIKWWGISIFADRILEDLLKEREEALTLSLVARFSVSKFPERVKEIANELLLRLDELSEWEYDKAVSLINLALALINLNQISEAKRYLDLALKWARAIPDRSDRSIVLSRIVPILFRIGEKEIAITLIDEIVYAPKKIEAIVAIASQLSEQDSYMLESLLKKCSEDDRPIILTTFAKAIASSDPDKAYELCQTVSSHYSKSESIRIVNLMLNCFSALVKTPNKVYREHAQQIYNKLLDILFKRIEERPYMNAFFQLLEVLVENKTSDKVSTILKRLEELATKKRPPENIFILNKIAYIRAKMGDLDRTVQNISLVLEISQNLEKLIAIPALIDTTTTIFSIMNTFPDNIPEDLVWSFAERIKPIEYVEITARLSRENIEFLRQMYPGRTVSEALNSIIYRERINDNLETERKTLGVIFNLVDRGEYIILHYVLKFIYTVGMSERERISILNMLGRAVEMLTSGKLDEAKNYIELIFARLKRLNLPISPILIEFLREYVLATFFR